MGTQVPDAARRRPDAIWLGSLTLLAAAIRLFRLGDWSFWADEIFTVRDALGFPAALTINPIPYGFIAAPLRLFGVSEWSARLFPALIGAFSVPVVAVVGARLFDRRSGLLAAVFVTLSPWHIFWSQNSRHYVFTFLFSTLAAAAFYEGFERGDYRRLVASWVAVGCLGLSHALAGALILGFAGYAAVVRVARERFEWTPSRLRFIAVFFAPFVVGGGVLLTSPVLREGLVSGWGHNLWARDALYIAATFGFGVTLPVAGAAAIGWLRRERAAKTRRAAAFLACAVGFPFAFLLASSFVQNVAGYYLFFVTPFVFLLAGRACGACFDSRSRAVGSVAVVAIVAALLTGDVAYFTTERGGREDWKGAFAELAPLLADGDRVHMLLPDVGRFYLASARVEKLALDDIREPERLLAQATGQTYVVVDAKAFEAVDPANEFRQWVERRGRRIVKRAVFARASDRTVEIFRLGSTSSETPIHPR